MKFLLAIFFILQAIVCIGFMPICLAASGANVHTAQDKQSISRGNSEETNNIRIYKNENKAVVNVSGTLTAQDAMFNLVPHEGYGSGTIISADGFILTNYHVIQHANTLRATIFDGTVLPAKVVGIDPSNDLAVIKINPPVSIKLTTIPYGDSSKLEVGANVLAIGNPFGLDRTMTHGIISSLGRNFKIGKRSTDKRNNTNRCSH